MQRREFLVGVTASSIGTIAGCAGITSPDIERIRTVYPEPYAVSVDTEGTEYFGTIHNRGNDGNVRLELWFFQDQSVPSPDESHLFNTSDRNDRVFDIARNSFFSENERREITINATQQQPEWDQREFAILPIPASYGGKFKNTGSSGEVEMRLEIEDTMEHELEEPSRKLQTVGSDEEFEAIFNIVMPAGVEYEIIAEPV